MPEHRTFSKITELGSRNHYGLAGRSDDVSVPMSTSLFLCECRPKEWGQCNLGMVWFNHAYCENTFRDVKKIQLALYTPKGIIDIL